MALRATHGDESRARVGGAGGHACAGSPDPAPQLDFRVSGCWVERTCTSGPPGDLPAPRRQLDSGVMLKVAGCLRGAPATFF